MILNDKLVCPSDRIQVNETKVRLVAGLVWFATLTYLLSGTITIPLLLTLDFGLRSFNLGQYSPFGNVAEWLVRAYQLPYKGTDQAPKRFAARVGLVFGLLISALQLLHVPTLIPAGMLFLFASLEAFTGFCAGCYVFTFYVRLFPKSI